MKEVLLEPLQKLGSILVISLGPVHREGRLQNFRWSALSDQYGPFLRELKTLQIP